jgi:hypothetical protein
MLDTGNVDTRWDVDLLASKILRKIYNEELCADAIYECRLCPDEGIIKKSWLLLRCKTKPWFTTPFSASGIHLNISDPGPRDDRKV